MRIQRFVPLLCGLILAVLWLAACSGTSASPSATPASTPPTLPPTLVPTTIPAPVPTLSLDETTATVKEFVVTDFDAVHSQAKDDPNKYLIFGNLPVSKPAADLPPELAAFLGRWEGGLDQSGLITQ